ncbi:KGG domain-containing protein [Priestia megaterium]|nr:KGG domain-containing protein [Priestia megaterium]
MTTNKNNDKEFYQEIGEKGSNSNNKRNND